MGSLLNLRVLQGSTFSQTLRWETQPLVYRKITGIPSRAPVHLTVPEHGVPDGWRVAIQSVQGMAQLNARNDPPERDDFVQATVVDADTIEINSINASRFSPYSSGGVVRFLTPVDLEGFTAALTVKDRFGGAVLSSILTDDGIELDNVKRTITYTFTAEQTTAFTFTSGVYALEMTSAGGVVTELLHGSITVEPR